MHWLKMNTTQGMAGRERRAAMSVSETVEWNLEEFLKNTSYNYPFFDSENCTNVASGLTLCANGSSVTGGDMEVGHPSLPNTTDRVSLAYETPVFAVIISIYLLLTCGTIFGNGLVLVAVFKFRRLRKSISNLLVCQLAFTDFLLGFQVLPLSSAHDSLGYWPFGEVLCALWLATDVLYCTASIWSLCVIAVDRFTATVFPVWYRGQRTPRRITIYLVVIWSLSIMISVTPFFGWLDVSKNYQLNEKMSKKHYHCILYDTPSYVVYSSAGSFFIPFSVMVLLYTGIVCALRRNSMRRRKANAKAQGSRKWTSTKRTTDASAGCKDALLEYTTAVTPYVPEDSSSGHEHEPRSASNLSPLHEEMSSIYYQNSATEPASTSDIDHLGTDSSMQSLRCHADEEEEDEEDESEREESAPRPFVFTVGQITAVAHAVAVSDDIGAKRRQRKTSSETPPPPPPPPARTSSVMPLRTSSMVVRSSRHQQESPAALGRMIDNTRLSVPDAREAAAAAMAHRRTSNESQPKGGDRALLQDELRNAATAGATEQADDTGSTARKWSRRVSNVVPQILTPMFSRRRRQSVWRFNERERRATKRMALIIFMFACSWLPFFIMYVYRSVCSTCAVNPHLQGFVIWLGYSNSAQNPLIYTVSNEEFRGAFAKLLGLNTQARIGGSSVTRTTRSHY